MKFINSPGKGSSPSIQDTPEQIRKKVATKKDPKKSQKRETKSRTLPQSEQSSHRKPDTSNNSEHEVLTGSSYAGPSCPKVYEEIIQGLEAEVRKHIRVEH